MGSPKGSCGDTSSAHSDPERASGGSGCNPRHRMSAVLSCGGHKGRAARPPTNLATSHAYTPETI